MFVRCRFLVTAKVWVILVGVFSFLTSLTCNCHPARVHYLTKPAPSDAARYVPTRGNCHSVHPPLGGLGGHPHTASQQELKAKKLFYAFSKDLLVVLESFCNFATIQPASPRGWVGQDMLIRTFTWRRLSSAIKLRNFEPVQKITATWASMSGVLCRIAACRSRQVVPVMIYHWRGLAALLILDGGNVKAWWRGKQTKCWHPRLFCFVLLENLPARGVAGRMLSRCDEQIWQNPLFCRMGAR